MAEEFDVFAGAMTAEQQQRKSSPGPTPGQGQGGGRPGKKFRKKFNRGGGSKPNTSPILGSNGE